MYRFYSPEKLSMTDPITLSDDELHHLKRVLRVRNGEKIEIVDGKGNLAEAIFDDEIVLKHIHHDPKPETKKVLIQAITEKNHLDFILEKATEIGISEFWFFPAERSKIKEISDSTLSRMKKITISAMKQCKRLHLPTIHLHNTLKEFQDLSLNLYLADPKGEAIIRNSNPTSDAIIVGPESGLTQKEIDFFINTCKAKKVSLSPNILRAETASIIASYLICT
jgi:16S rRNA (uracil1498-N3)-methyltransferase